MKLGPIAENPIETIVNALGLSPGPLLETHIAMLLARAVMEGSRLGVFATLAEGPLAAAEIAERCGAHPRATRKLLDALRRRERSVGELVGVARVSQPSVSQHLKVLREAGLVAERRDGRFRYYRLRAAPLADVMRWVRAYERFWTGRLAALGRVLDGMEEGDQQ